MEGRLATGTAATDIKCEVPEFTDILHTEDY
jgi:hypothetical protein